MAYQLLLLSMSYLIINHNDVNNKDKMNDIKILKN